MAKDLANAPIAAESVVLKTDIDGNVKDYTLPAEKVEDGKAYLFALKDSDLVIRGNTIPDGGKVVLHVTIDGKDFSQALSGHHH